MTYLNKKQRKQTKDMPPSTYITLVIIYTLEAVLIVFGKAFLIFVFWTERSRLKRTYFLLINLAVADLLVGITEFIIIGTAKSHNVGEGAEQSKPDSGFYTSLFGYVRLFSCAYLHRTCFRCLRGNPSSHDKQSSLQL